MLNRLVDHEGGYVNIPEDRGGPTNMGITLPTMSEWLGRKAQLEDIKNLNGRAARALYWELFLFKTNIYKLPDLELMEHVLDCAVLHGRKTGPQWLQAALNVEPDGLIGPITLNAAGSQDTPWAPGFRALSNDIAVRRIKFMVAIVKSRPDQLKFLVGWINRATSFIK
jgi:lysozyme family protein